MAAVVCAGVCRRVQRCAGVWRRRGGGRAGCMRLLGKVACTGRVLRGVVWSRDEQRAAAPKSGLRGAGRVTGSPNARCDPARPITYKQVPQPPGRLCHACTALPSQKGTRTHRGHGEGQSVTLSLGHSWPDAVGRIRLVRDSLAGGLTKGALGPGQTSSAHRRPQYGTSSTANLPVQLSFIKAIHAALDMAQVSAFLFSARRPSDSTNTSRSHHHV